MRDLFYIILGYLSGSILFANLSARLLGRDDITENTSDRNPGTANAFRNGGLLCGCLTLAGDMLKGFLPVWLYLTAGNPDGTVFAFVLAAPVIGHILPVFHGFRGGKGIAASFGCLLGLLPDYGPVAILACCFLFFSVILRITPNYYRTLLTYLCAGILLMIFSDNSAVSLGFALIMLAVINRLLVSQEEKERCKVEFLWKH